jgi:FMN phosphatase YigB (HAD superfamily)
VQSLPLINLNRLDPKTFDVVSVDVFDTALLRDNKGQRERFSEVAAEQSERLAREGHEVDADLLLKLRLLIHGLAYEAVSIERPHGDANLARMQTILATLLGLDASCLGQMQEAEVAVERQSLRANSELVKWLLALRAEGKQVIAISDMYLPTKVIDELIVEKIGRTPIQRTYVSSDLGLTKRSGKLFARVAALEGVPLARIFHFGDHPLSDVDMPRAAGMQAMLLSRPKLQRAARKILPSVTALTAPRSKAPTSRPTRITSRRDFGRQILGPIFAEFALKMWVLLSNLEQPNETVLLFCARSGLRLQVIYEAFLAATKLDSPVATQSLMISRIVAVRSALLKKGPAAFEQIDYEFGGRSLREIARAIGGVEPDEEDSKSTQSWNQTYSKTRLEALIDSPIGQFVSAISEQDDLFREHLETRSLGRKHIILCDTGLFGSTLQLLSESFPEKVWSCLQFARSNYKGLPTPHFDKVVGFATQRDHYSPLDARTSILRHWHLIEGFLEPNLPSVRSFSRVDGVVRSNLETGSGTQRVESEQDELFSGVLEYMGAQNPNDGTARIMSDVETAYRRLKRAIVWPTRNDVKFLDFANRSMDFGKDGHVPTIARRVGVVRAARNSLWREGAIAEVALPILRLPFLASLEGLFVGRWLLYGFFSLVRKSRFSTLARFLRLDGSHRVRQDSV